MTKKQTKTLSKNDKELLREANTLVELMKSNGYEEYLRPFLFQLSQEGYPQPSKFKNKESLILSYTEKCGETNAVKKIVAYIEGAEQTIKTINKKLDEQKVYDIGA